MLQGEEESEEGGSGRVIERGRLRVRGGAKRKGEVCIVWARGRWVERNCGKGGEGGALLERERVLIRTWRQEGARQTTECYLGTWQQSQVLRF
jgi:hypothetical protein